MTETTLQIRLLTEADIPAGMQLKNTAGWNQTEADWRRLLRHDPQGCFAALAGSRLVGTATSTAYGTDLAWIGMVIVAPEFRRQGIATKLMRTTLTHLQTQGVRTVKLDATPAGRQVYVDLGFADELTIERWEAVAQPQTTAHECRPLAAHDWPAVLELDRQAFGTDRARLLTALRADSVCALVADNDGMQGFALARHGSVKTYLGPIIAQSPEIAARLLDGLLATLAGHTVFLDLNLAFADGKPLLETRGFAKQRDLIRMQTGALSSVGTSAQVFAVAGLEIG